MYDRGDPESALDMARLDAFFDSLDHLGEIELLAMAAAWRSVDRATHGRAWAAVRAAGDRDGVSDEIGRVRDLALAWATRGSNVPPYQINNEPTWAREKLQAQEAVVDAALAIALGDRLDHRTSDELLAPWKRARASFE
jgi:hypothetical protein